MALENFVASGGSYSMAAQALLNRVDRDFYYGEVRLPDTTQQRRHIHILGGSQQLKPTMLVYPNPAKESVNIEFAGLRGAGYELRMHNSSGVSLGKWPIDDGDYYIGIGLGKYPSGIYTLTLYRWNEMIDTRTINVIK